MQLPEPREIETRRRLLQLFPDARELRPPAGIQSAIEGIAAALAGIAAELSDIALDLSDIPAFDARVYEFTRTIARGETRSCAEVARSIKASGAEYSVAQALAKNPFMLIVPCHRVLDGAGHSGRISPFAGSISRRRLLGIDGAAPRTLFDVLLPIAPLRPQG